YSATDLIAGLRYPGYSFDAQTVSELFAIGAPTSSLVVPLFSLASLLYLAFALGVWRASAGRGALAWVAILVAAGAVNSLVLWNFFPMHMRGTERTFTDLMHLILAVNPFIMISIVAGAVAFENWFRRYSVLTIVVLVVIAAVSFHYAPLAVANQPTPRMG